MAALFSANHKACLRTATSSRNAFSRVADRLIFSCFASLSKAGFKLTLVAFLVVFARLAPRRAEGDCGVFQVKFGLLNFVNKVKSTLLKAAFMGCCYGYAVASSKTTFFCATQ